MTSKQTLEREMALRREIEAIVFDAQRAGFERRDLAGYMAVWTEDARLIAGRTEQAGPHDVTLSRSQIEATKRERLPHFPELTLAFVVQRFEHDGRTVLMQILSTVRDSESHVEQNAERYWLRREGGTWKVFANRYWPVRLTTKTRDIVYGTTTWQELDAAVRQTAAGTIERAYALVDAHQVHEAYAEAKRLTDDHADDISAWYLRYQLALRVGAIEDIGVCNQSIASLEGQ